MLPVLHYLLQLLSVLVWTAVAARRSQTGYRAISESSADNSDQEQQQEDYVSNGAKCHFPAKWRGHWLQFEADALKITANEIPEKGKCMQQNGEQFLFKVQTKEVECWRCMIVLQRHDNILQYKETICGRKDRMEEVCSRFYGDAELVTLFRANAKPHPCPVQGPFNFTYNNYRGSCHSRISSASTCASSTVLQLQYIACPEVAGSESRTDTVECIGEWSLGDTQFFATRTIGTNSLDHAKGHRCVIYERHSSGGMLGISADASCQELVDVTSASIRLSFHTNSPVARCSFKGWLVGQHKHHRTAWDSLSSQLVHSFLHDEWLTVDEHGRNVSLRRCINSEDFGDMQQYLIHSVEGCTSGYRCARIWRRHAQVAEARLGQLSSDEDACETAYDDDATATTVTLLRQDSETEACPGKGRYKVHGCEHDEATISHGCSAEHELVLAHRCKEKQKTFNCYGRWSSGSLSFVVLREQKTGHRSCYAFSRDKDDVAAVLYSNDNCKAGIIVGVNTAEIINASWAEHCNPQHSKYSSNSQARTASAFQVAMIALLLCSFCAARFLR